MSDRVASRSPADFVLATEQHTTTLLLRLAGDFDLSAAGRVEAALACAVRTRTQHIVFDLREVTFLDLAAMTALIRVNERSHRESFDVQIVRPAGLARRVFTLTRAGDQLTLLEDLPAAVMHRPDETRSTA